MNVLICIPTYNEVENIERLIGTVFERMPKQSTSSVIVIDDNSPDGTASIVERLIRQYPDRLHIIKRPGKQGGASAFLEGFSWGIDRGYDAMLAMDADFSHDPKFIPLLLERIHDHDVVIGSRLIKGGGIENRSFTRNIISRGASLYCRLLLGVPIKDWTGGFNLWSKKALLKIGIKNIVTRGYSFQIEMKYKAYREKCKISEVPIIFPDRRFGVSKMPVSYFIKALVDVWQIKFMYVRTGIKQFVKFGITGGLGTITNLLLFFMFVDKIGLPEIPISIGCFIIAGTQNYTINHKWTFSTNTVNSTLSAKKWIAFLSGSLAGLIINIVVMQLMIINLDLPFKFFAQACGIAAGMLINYSFSKFVVFGRKS